MKTLNEIYKANLVNGWPDKGSIHSYIDVYEEVLKPYRERPYPVFIEIGLFSGQSLRMWEQYFSEASTVYGIDCSDQPCGGLQDLRPMIAEGTHNIIIMDGTSPEDIEKHFKDVMFDVIIDDGSHNLEHQLASYKHFKSHLSKGGIYIIEDIQSLDANREVFENIDPDKTVTILDRRSIKNRYDDLLIII
jgi:cephalosporin hydroxylase